MRASWVLGLVVVARDPLELAVLPELLLVDPAARLDADDEDVELGLLGALELDEDEADRAGGVELTDLVAIRNLRSFGILSSV